MALLEMSGLVPRLTQLVRVPGKADVGSNPTPWDDSISAMRV